MATLKYGIGLAVVLTQLGLIFVALGSFAVFAVVGAWDLLGWLTNADWKTTHFVVPFFALAAFAVACAVNKALWPVLDWAERGQGHW